MSDWFDLCEADEIPSNSGKVVNTEIGEIAIFKIGGKFYAIENICSHDGNSLAGGDVEGDQIICPRHGARFSLETGEALSPPAYEPITTFPVRVSSGVVQIQDNRWD